MPAPTMPPPTTMPAVTHSRYGAPDEVLEITDVDRPVPAADQVLLEVIASSVNPFDWHFTTGRPWMLRAVAGLRRPKEPRRGSDVAGRVSAVGADVTEFAVGDLVFGGAAGTFAPWATSRPRNLAAIPEGADPAEMAALPIAGATAYQALVEQAEVAAGQRVLINGAAGGVGTMAVQIAKALDAHVTGVCSTRNVEMVAGLGADEVVDYTTDDVIALGGEYDVIIDNVGNRSAGELLSVLAGTGICVATSGPKSNPLFGPVLDGLRRKARFALARRRFTAFTARLDAPTMQALADLVADRKLRSAIDRHIKLDEIPAALVEIGGGHARAKIVVDIAGARGHVATSANEQAGASE